MKTQYAYVIEKKKIWLMNFYSFFEYIQGITPHHIFMNMVKSGTLIFLEEQLPNWEIVK